LKNSFSTNKKTILLLIILSTFLYYIPGIFSPRDFWVEDEARYAEVVRELITYGDILVMRLNDHPYPDKPPIYFWLAALSSMLFGKITVFSFMLVTWLSTLGTVLTTYYFGQKLFDPKTAIYGVSILMSLFLFVACASIVRMDMLMTFFITLALYQFWLGQKDQKTIRYILFWTFSALAVLTKGPLGIAFTLLPVVGFLIIERDWINLRKLIVNPGPFLFLAFVLGWLGLAWLVGYRDFVENIVFKQIINRATDSFIHKRPFYFYIVLFPLLILPWTAFLPRAIKTVFRDFQRSEIYFVVAWFVFGLLTISVVSGKLFIYVLPILPPVALILGKHFSEIFQVKMRFTKGLRLESLLGIVLFFGIFFIAPMVATKNMDTSGFSLIPLVVISTVFMLIGLYIFLTGRPVGIFLLLIVGMWVISAYLFFWLAPSLDKVFSSRNAGNQIAQLIDKGDNVAIHKVRRGIFNFYANDIFHELTEVDAVSFVEESPRNILLIRKQELANLFTQSTFTSAIDTVAIYDIANSTYYLVKKYVRN